MSVSLLAAAAVAVGLAIVRQRPPAKPATPSPVSAPKPAPFVAPVDAIRSAGF